ncbi:MAG: TIGR02301 family protein [Robiginitomaculum sp.]|nr:MAG: TIGR02301 family protein [Robiginitomaculum sp.]
MDRPILAHRLCLVTDPCKTALLSLKIGFAACLLVFFASSALAQSPVQRPPDTRRTMEKLAETIGAIHYLHVVCQGRKTQDWRDRMVEMLELENPGYRARGRLIGAFNQGYRQQARRFPDCGSQIDRQIQIKAEQGRILSDALADPYLR